MPPSAAVAAASIEDTDMSNVGTLASRAQAQDAERARIFLAVSKSIFPNVTLDQRVSVMRGAFERRVVDDHTIVRLRTAVLAMETDPCRARQEGISGKLKLSWLMNGSARFEDARGVMSVRAGQAIVLPMDTSYRMEMDADYDGLHLIFDPATRPQWRELMPCIQGRVLDANAAVCAAGASVATLMRHAESDRTGTMVLDGALDLVFRTALMESGGDAQAIRRPAGRLRHAALLVGQHLDDPTYGPEALARDLAMSRRSLYAEFARLGLTPAGFIRQQRLERARGAILQHRGRPVSLTEIALRHGFTDSSSFSRAFRNAFGLAPSELKANV